MPTIIEKPSLILFTGKYSGEQLQDIGTVNMFKIKHGRK